MPDTGLNYKNTFGMLVDGKPWVPYTSKEMYPDGYSNAPDLSWTWRRWNMLGARIMAPDDMSAFNIYFDGYWDYRNQKWHSVPFPITQKGIYKFGDFKQRTDGNTIYTGAWFTDYSNESHNDYFCVKEHPGYMIITQIDTVRQFVSGTFEATVVCTEIKDTIRITEGSFDMFYHTN